MPTNKNDTFHPPTKQPNLCNIDLLRGLATIAILLWHYQHFYYPQAGMPLAGWTPDQQPMFASLEWLYLKGEWAVRFFWILSGFIFFHVYAQRREISLREFFVNRFSRLYPLHFITLCLVAVLQIVSMTIFNHYQIYLENNPYHFFLNLIFASHWGFQSGFSFNAPIWSVSVEVLAYTVFFCYLKVVGASLLSSATWLLCSLLFLKFNHGAITECIAFFSLGGCVHELGEVVRKRFGALCNAACATVLLLAVLAFLFSEENLSASRVQWLLFPTLILFAYALDGINVSASRVGVAFGHLTYASYLIHIPVQITLLITLDGIIGSRSAVNSPLFLFGFVGSVLALAWFTYTYVERPAQSYFRRSLTKGKESNS
jgi:peptidoglycan/LPS O-acetylase OafA/YrhL